MCRFNHSMYEGDAMPPRPQRGARRTYRKIALILTRREDDPTSEEQVRHACAKARRTIAMSLLCDPVVRRALAGDANWRRGINAPQIGE